MSHRLLVLYGTETGNSQDVAKRIGREAQLYGLAPVVQSVHTYDVLSLPTEELVTFVVATTGQGDVPVKMHSFWKFIFRKSLKDDSLKGLTFGVFGLGDSAYVKFNVVAKKLHNRLNNLGAQKLLDRGLGDDQADEGYEAALDPWLSNLWETLSAQLCLPPPIKQSGLGDSSFLVKVATTEDLSIPESQMDWFKDSVDSATRFLLVNLHFDFRG